MREKFNPPLNKVIMLLGYCHAKKTDVVTLGTPHYNVHGMTIFVICAVVYRKFLRPGTPKLHVCVAVHTFGYEQAHKARGDALIAPP